MGGQTEESTHLLIAIVLVRFVFLVYVKYLTVFVRWEKEKQTIKSKVINLDA